MVDVGDGKSQMASMYFGKGSRVSNDMWNPAKSTILRGQYNLSALRTISAWTTLMRKSMVLHQCVCRSVS